MTTAADLIYSGREYAGRARQGETLSGTLLTASLNTLNAMLDYWRTQRLFAYRIREETFTWTATQSRTVGSAGNFATDRPVKVDESTVFRVNDIDHPITLVDAEGWAAIPDKQTTATIPTHIYAEQGASLMTLYAYPIPSASISIILKTWQLIQSFTASTTEMTLPPGYQHAIETSLGELLCMKASKPVPPELREAARMARGAIKAVNAVTPLLRTDLSRQYAYNINLG